MLLKRQMIIWRHIWKYILIERMQMTKQKKYFQLTYKVSKNVDDRKPYENFTSDINKQFIGKKMQITLTYMKKCSTAFIIREILIKTTIGYNFSPIILAKPQNFDIILCWQDFKEQALS